MSNVRVANRYAEAILDAVPEGVSVDRFLSELEDVRASVRHSRELQLFFESPILTEKQKSGAVTALFQDRVHPYVHSVLQLLVKRGREDLLLDIIAAVEELRRQREGIVVTTVHSAVELTEEQRRHLQEVLASVSGKRIEATYDVDGALMGGLTVRLGDTVYDGSVRHTLKRLRDRFVSGR